MANQQAAVTVTGFVAGDPVKGGNDNFVVLTFRMGSTRSRFNAATRQWEDYGTAWLTVKAFRALAANTLQSVRRGDRIIVVGVLNTEQWTTEQGELRSRTVIEATNIGHDLTFGTTALAKAQRNGGANNGGNGSNGGNGGAMQQGTAPEQAGPALEPTRMRTRRAQDRWSSASPKTPPSPINLKMSVMPRPMVQSRLIPIPGSPSRLTSRPSPMALRTPSSQTKTSHKTTNTNGCSVRA